MGTFKGLESLLAAAEHCTVPIYGTGFLTEKPLSLNELFEQ